MLSFLLVKLISGLFYREKFGDFAGWTQALLFNAQLEGKERVKRTATKGNNGMKKERRKEAELRIRVDRKDASVTVESDKAKRRKLR